MMLSQERGRAEGEEVALSCAVPPPPPPSGPRTTHSRVAGGSKVAGGSTVAISLCTQGPLVRFPVGALGPGTCTPPGHWINVGC